MRRLRFWLLALFLSAAQSALAQTLPILELRPSDHPLATIGHLERFVDESAALGFEQVQQATFVPVRQLRSAGYSSAAHWYRLRVQRPAAVADHWILAMGEPYLDDLQVWVASEGRVLGQRGLGDHVPMQQRALKTQTHAISLALPADTPVDIYVRVQSISALNFNAALWSSEAFLASETRFNFVQGWYFGLLLLISLINLLFGVWLRDGAMLSFSLYALTLLLFFFSIHGYAAFLVTAELPWLADAVTGVGVIGGIAAAIFTWGRLLGLRQSHPRINRMYLLVVVLCLAALPFSTGPFYSLMAPTLFKISLAWMLFTSVLVVLIWNRTRYTEFAFYMMAIFFNVAGGAVQICLPLGWLPINAWTEYAHQTSSLIQALLMSLGLTIRIGKLRGERQRMEQEMRLAEQRASEQRRFVAMLSHEFRNPLAVIDRSAQMVILGTTQMSASDQQRLQNIRGGVAMLSTLVDSFLRTEAQQHSPLPLKVADCSLRDFLDSEVGSLGQEAQARIEIKLPLAPTHWAFDRALVGMALRNLLINALRYSPQDRAVVLRVQFEVGELILSVEDSGPGLGDEELSQLGEPYYRASSSTGKQGTGLGYHFSRQIVGAHGGRLEARNRPDGGLIVSVHLPASGFDTAGG